MGKKIAEITLILFLIVLSWVYFIIDFSILPVVVFIISFVLLILAIPIKEKGREKSKEEEIEPKKEEIADLEKPDEEKPIINFPNNFDEDKFLEEIFVLYKDIQDDFMNFEFDSIMKKLGLEMYEQFTKQMKSLKNRNKQSVRTNITLDKIQIISFIQDKDSYISTINISVTEDKYIKGMKDALRITSSGVKYESCYNITVENIHKKKTVKKCNNCNEKNVNNASKCPKCDSMLIETPGTWIMTDLKLVCSHSKKGS